MGLHAQVEYALDSAPAFTVRTRNEAVVNTAREQADGRLVMSGNLRYIDGMPNSGFARFQSDGQVDPTFVPPANGVIGRWTTAANGGLFMIGPLWENDPTQIVLALTTVDGALDPSFTPVNISNLAVREVIALPDGGCYLITTLLPAGSTGILRFTATGQPAPGYPSVNVGTGLMVPALGPVDQLAFVRANSAGPSAVIVVNAAGVTQPSLSSIPTNFRPFGVVYQPDGALVISGQTSPGVGPGLIRILANGQRDLTFTGNSPFNNFGGSNIARLADGSFVTLPSSGGPASQPHVLRFSSTGAYLSAASLFLDNGQDGPTGNLIFLPLADGDYLLTGRFLAVNGILAPSAARISPAGQVRDGFHVDFTTRGRIAAFTPFGAGGQLLAGSFTEIGDANPGNLAILTDADTISTGVPYLPFGGPSYRSFSTLDGGAVVMSGFPPLTGTTTTGLVKIKPDGQVDTGFLADATLFGFEAGVQLADGRIVLAGRFGAQPTPIPPASYLVRLLPDGSIDPTFNNHSTVTGAPANITAIAAAPDGSLIIAGSFNSFQGATRRGLAKTFPDGMIDPLFVPAVGFATGSPPRQITSLPDGRFYVLGIRDDESSGLFRLLRFNADGSIDETFAPAPGRGITAYTVAADGSLFAQIGPLPPTNGNPAEPRSLVKLTPAGEIETTLSAQIDGPLMTLAIDELDRLLVGGLFTAINGQPREALARFSPIPFGVTIDGPAEIEVLKHSIVTFTTDIVSAPGAVSYQWYQDGEAIEGQTGASLVLTHIVPKHAGDYTVTATSGSQVATSAPVRLVVLKGKPEKD